MDILRREIAPIEPVGWSLIDTAAKEALTARLSARKFADIDGPHGIDYAAEPLGRLKIVKEDAPGGLGYGIHQVLPLVEVRRFFDLPIWEMDNLVRGAADVNLDPLIAACRSAAEFEDAAVYDGLKPAGIVGLNQVAGEKNVPLKLTADGVVDAIGEAKHRLIEAGIDAAAHLVASPAVWKYLSRITPAGVLREVVEKQLGGSVVRSAAVKGALLVASRGGDAILTLGQDFAVGYHSHTATKVSLFLTESFTFRVATPEALVGFAVG
jgi:uncharacterized linocin/CFP29 family protein